MTKVSGVLRMSLKAGLAAGALMLATAGGAQAQFFGFRYDYGYDDPIPIGAGDRGTTGRRSCWTRWTRAKSCLRCRREASRASLSRYYREDLAIVRAVNPAGRPVRLTIDIFSGRIVDREIDRQEPRPERRPQ